MIDQVLDIVEASALFREPNRLVALMETVTTLFFDFGGVLVDVDKSRAAKLFRELSGRSESVFYDIFFDGDWHDLVNSGEVTPAEYFAYVAARGEVDPAVIERVWRAVVSPRRDLLPFVRVLRSRYRLGIISDTDPCHLETILESGEFEVFEPIVTSFQTRCRKPCREIFLSACQRAGCRPEQAVFFDDLERNVLGATAIGMIAHQVVSRTQFLQILQIY